MRRFWKEVALEQSTHGLGILLDGRALKTPKRNALSLPTQALADAVMQEWIDVGEMIDPLQMPLTGFANAAVDHVTPDRAGFAAAIAAYGESDAFCYRAEPDEPLAPRQAEVWDPWLDWAQTRYDVSFRRVAGVLHQPQPEADFGKAAYGGHVREELLNWRPWQSLPILLGRLSRCLHLSSVRAARKNFGRRFALRSYGRKPIGAQIIGRKKTAPTAKLSI